MPPKTISSGTLEALKCLGVVVMTVDHVNKYLLGYSQQWAFALGRLAMPIFGLVLAYNLARPEAFKGGMYQRTMRRLTLSGLAATPFFIALGGLISGWWPLNIMFMLLVATGTLYLVEQRGLARAAGAPLVFLTGGALVEFWWFAVAFIVCAWWYFKTDNPLAIVLCTLILSALVVINGNLWAVSVVLVMLFVHRIKLDLPRAPRFFYMYYPAHLGVILLIANIM